MIRVKLATVALLAVVASAGVVPAAGADAERQRPRLKIVTTDPFVVRGTAFRARERVRLLVVASSVYERTVKAKPNGTFVVRLKPIGDDPCMGVSVQAIGNRGSRADAWMLRIDCVSVAPPGERPGDEPTLAPPGGPPGPP
jgi:hypothetical protein